MAEPGPEAALAEAARHLRRLRKRFALVGGLAVSVRAEVRFTRDVDLAIDVASDAETEALVQALRGSGYEAIVLVEHTEQSRLATVRLESPNEVVVDLIAASTGIESEIVARATPVELEGIGTIPVARAEELLAMKVLSVTDARPQDAIDAVNLVLYNEGLGVDDVREALGQITARGYHRDQDLPRKLDAILEQARRAR